MPIYKKLANVVKEVPNVKKAKMFSSVNYRSIGDLINILSPILDKESVILVPSKVSDFKSCSSLSKNGTQIMTSSYIQEFKFIDGEDGSFMTVEVACEGQDAGSTDKATRVAFSYAMKSVLECTFFIAEREQLPPASTPELPIKAAVIETKAVPALESKIAETPTIPVAMPFFTADVKNKEDYEWFVNLIKETCDAVRGEGKRDAVILREVWNEVNGKYLKEQVPHVVEDIFKKKFQVHA